MDSLAGEEEVVGLDVGVQDVRSVESLHHGQDAHGKVHDEGLGQRLGRQLAVEVRHVLHHTT